MDRLPERSLLFFELECPGGAFLRADSTSLAIPEIDLDPDLVQRPPRDPLSVSEAQARGVSIEIKLVPVLVLE